MTLEEKYPELTNEGKEQAQILINRLFEESKKTVVDILNEYTLDVYANILPYIESDAWENFRSSIMNYLMGYNQQDESLKSFYKTLRSVILKEHREEIINDLNQDNMDEIASLKESLNRVCSNRY